uniref:Uncharacterized protein n=1 Tax=Arundo donax TaxID=35708 RepID=A0A0A9AEA0_ARUDO
MEHLILKKTFQTLASLLCTGIKFHQPSQENMQYY